MASGNPPKRSSMREGPLAALFRKTETEGLEAPPAPVPTPQERLRSAFSADLPENGPPNVDQHPPGGQESTVGESGAMAPWSSVQPLGLPQLTVVGVGGAGVNAVNRMVEAEVGGVEFVAVNTDAQSLQQSAAHVTLQIGHELTRGLGAGSDPESGRAAAMEDYDRAKALLKGADMIFITAGAGGGTGTGAAPVIARIARELGALCVGIVTKPFGFEGTRRLQQAEDGIALLAEEVDTLIVVPNNRLLSVLDRHTSMVDAFRVADDVLRQGVQGISDLITLPGLINLDFADVRTIMSGAGPALLGIGMGQGETRAVEAAEKAVSSPLLETSIEGAKKILLSITGGRDISLWEVNEAARVIGDAAHPEANIIFGANVDDRLDDDQVWITVVATGFGPGRPAGVREVRAGTLREPAGEPRVSRLPPRAALVVVAGRRRGARVHSSRDLRNPASADRPPDVIGWPWANSSASKSSSSSRSSAATISRLTASGSSPSRYPPTNPSSPPRLTRPSARLKAAGVVSIASAMSSAQIAPCSIARMPGATSSPGW